MSSSTIIAAQPMEMVENYSGSLLRDFLNVLFKRKWLILIFFLTTFTTVAGVSILVSAPKYQATSQILVSPGREHIADLSLPTGGAMAPRLSFNADEEMARTIEMLTGRFLAESVAQAIGPTVLYRDLEDRPRRFFGLLPGRPLDPQGQLEVAVGRFAENIIAEPAGKSALINVSFRHEDPEMAAKVVNVLGEKFLARHLGVQKNPRTDAFFQEQFELLKQKLQESEKRLEQFKQRNDINSTVKDEQELASKQQVASQTSLSDTRKQLAEISSRMQELRSQLGNTSRNAGTINILQDKLTSLELQENELGLRVTAEHPTLRSLRQEIQLVREKIAKMEGSKAYGTSASRDGGLFGKLQEELLHHESEQRALGARADSEIVRLAEVQKRVAALDRIDIEFNHLQQQLQMDQQNYKLYLTKFEESRISNAMDVEKIASIRVIEPAQPPRSPLNSKLSIKILLGLLFGLVGGIALALVLEFLGGRLDTIEDIERYLDLPVLASIPELKLK
jgi:polysaccharide biosynthesis protein PslE